MFAWADLDEYFRNLPFIGSQVRQSAGFLGARSVAPDVHCSAAGRRAPRALLPDAPVYIVGGPCATPFTAPLKDLTWLPI